MRELGELGRWLDRAIGSVLGRSVDAVTESRLIEGVRVDVVNTRPDIETERVFRRAEAVLALVREYQPWRFAHLQRDLGGIVVRRFPSRGAYFSETRSCLLELTFMANESFSDAQVAACLVHEGTHARLDRLAERFGVTSFADAPARHERICRRAELAFGLVVPEGGPVVERALASLALADEEVAPAIDWREAARRTAAVDDAATRRSE
jgi:hypothetical protein